MATTNSSPLPISLFDYDLPPERIAQVPLEPRDAARLLVLERRSGQIHHSLIRELPRWLATGDLIVANNTRVFPARVKGRKRDTGGAVELLLLRQLPDHSWRALAKPVRKLRVGTRISVQAHDASVEPLEIEVIAIEREGEVVVRSPDLTPERLNDYGSTPLPPYIGPALSDAGRYQTLHASVLGSAAAPTAGLHVTPALRAGLVQAGIGWAEITLHVGLDTFRTVAVEDLNHHHIHQESYTVSHAASDQIASARQQGGCVVALGTTSARTLETLGSRKDWSPSEAPDGLSGETDLFIRPGHQWTVVDAMVTNFHLPKSTLLVMVSAFAGRENILNAYHEAIQDEYRFFSFGDAMLII